MPNIGAVGLLALERGSLLFNAVAWGPDGALRPAPRDRLRFAFDFQGATFMVEGRRDGERLVLCIEANLGPLPFSAEGVGARSAIQELVAMNARSRGANITIDLDQVIRVTGRLDVEQGTSPVEVIASLTGFLLELKPWLTRLAELLTDPSLRSNRPA